MFRFCNAVRFASVVTVRIVSTLFPSATDLCKAIVRIGVLTGLITLSACSLAFPRNAGDGLPDFESLAPQPGSRIGSISVRDLDGNVVALPSLAKGKPTVLQLGSYTCPVFRYRRFDMQELIREYGDRVLFLVIYTREAHPVGSMSPYREGEWDPLINRLSGVRLDQPDSAEERFERAHWAQSAMAHGGRFLVDDMDNTAWSALGKAPSAAWVIDAHGTVRLTQPWVEPSAIADTLDLLLDETDTSAKAADGSRYKAGKKSEASATTGSTGGE